VLVGCGPLPFQSQPPRTRVPRIGYVSGGSATSNQAPVDAFQQGLRDLGYTGGQNILVDWRWGEGDDARLAEPLAELVRTPADIIVVTSTQLAGMARAATDAIPIVVTGTGGERTLVAEGLAVSLARPGGNVTGLT